MTALKVTAESWPIDGTFTISRGSKTAADVVVVELTTPGGLRGRGECVPYGRYGETVEGVMAALRALEPAVAGGLTRAALAELLPAGAARNALDCALWDLEGARTGRPVWELAGLPAPRPVETAETLSLDTPDAMAAMAQEVAGNLLKLKVGDDGVLERVAAVHAAAPHARLIVDANEAWTLEQTAAWLPDLAALGVVLIEQPLPAGQDGGLAGLGTPAVPICADESVHTVEGLRDLVGRYQAVNIKLDKAGGLTEALRLRREAEALGFAIMVGCMVGTSLAMAPALLLAQGAAFVDLDGPLMLRYDRPDGVYYHDGWAEPPSAALWGGSS
ncbi:MAG: N-acetyl-D-Glu racemase DgcA [Rhodospirillaceae bacterium]